jgi:hypothetical protein
MESETRQRAENRLRRKQGAQAHAVAYLLANGAMIIGWATAGGHFWPMWPLIGWGAGLTVHLWSAYRRDPPEWRVARELRRLP